MPRPLQPIYKDKNGHIRFEANKIVRILLDTSKLDLNDLSKMDFSVEDQEQFFQLIGYSLTGFGELSFVSDEIYNKAKKVARKLK
jgi:hypothetical protein